MQFLPRAARELQPLGGPNDCRSAALPLFDDPRAPFGLSHEPVEVAAALRGHHLNLDALASIVEEIGGGNATSLLANVTLAPPPPPPPPRRRARAASDVRLTVFGVTLFRSAPSSRRRSRARAALDGTSGAAAALCERAGARRPRVFEQLPLLQPPMEQRRSRRRSSPSSIPHGDAAARLVQALAARRRIDTNTVLCGTAWAIETRVYSKPLR